MPAELMSESAWFDPIAENALCQGTTSVVPKKSGETTALAAAASFPSRYSFGQLPAAQPAMRTLLVQLSIAAEGTVFALYSTFFRSR